MNKIYEKITNEYINTLPKEIRDYFKKEKVKEKYRIINFDFIDRDELVDWLSETDTAVVDDESDESYIENEEDEDDECDEGYIEDEEDEEYYRLFISSIEKLVNLKLKNENIDSILLLYNDEDGERCITDFDFDDETCYDDDAMEDAWYDLSYAIISSGYIIVRKDKRTILLKFDGYDVYDSGFLDDLEVILDIEEK